MKGLVLYKCHTINTFNRDAPWYGGCFTPVGRGGRSFLGPLIRASEPRRGETEGGRVKKVLLVDDDAVFLESLKDGLEQYADGIGYLVASDGREALELLARNRVVTLVTDLKMPGLDGMGLLTEVFQKTPDIPCIVMTAHGNAELEKTFAVYSIEYVEKPIDIDHLHRLILKMAGRCGLQGQMKETDLPGFVQMLALERKSCRLEVYRCFGGERGVLYFSEGTLADARLGSLPPREAALEIMGWRNVYLRVGALGSGCRRKLETPLVELLLEAARLADEKGAEPDCGLDHLDDALSEAEPDKPPERGKDDISRSRLKDSEMRGLSELLDRFGKLSDFEGMAVYSPDGELRGFFLPIAHLTRYLKTEG